jgi:hypothetical protein
MHHAECRIVVRWPVTALSAAVKILASKGDGRQRNAASCVRGWKMCDKLDGHTGISAMALGARR